MNAMQCIKHQPIEQNPLRYRHVSLPEPGENELLLSVTVCGLCHTDLHVIEGELPTKKMPIIPGHQVVGIIQQVGTDVVDYKKGERVGVAWLYSTCGVCDFCNRGDENLCSKATFTGYDVDGGYAEYIVVPSSYAYPLPPNFSDEHAAPLLCAGIIGFRALRLSGLNPGERLALYGFGASAHIALQIAKYWGCEIYVFSRGEQHRKFAERLGATWTGTSDIIPPHLVHSAICFAPVGDLIPKALRVLRKGGTLALAGIYMSPVPSFDYSLLYHERTIRSVANSTRKDAFDFLKIAAEIPIQTEVEVFPLNEANRALQLVKSSKIQGAGVLRIRKN